MSLHYAILNASVILERNETQLARNEKHLERNETRLTRNKTRGGNLLLSGTVVPVQYEEYQYGLLKTALNFRTIEHSC